jgi:hypothetical protein
LVQSIDVDLVFLDSPQTAERRLKKLEVGAEILKYFDLDMNGATTV